MVVVDLGKNWEGKEIQQYFDSYLLDNLQRVKDVVSKKDFDFVSIVAGLPGLGKSTFAINCCKFLDPNFSLDNICFTAEEFIEVSNNLPNRSAIMLDESFAGLNSRISNSRDFLKIINHLQLIRQKNLYIFLCLPNFFDLQKGIAIYRSSFLFVTYGESFGDRGRFLAFDRDRKKSLYINGLKYMNYNAAKANFYGQFYKQKVIDQEAYEAKKLKHLKDQNEKETRLTTPYKQRNKLLWYLRYKLNIPTKEVALIGEIEIPALRKVLQSEREQRE